MLQSRPVEHSGPASHRSQIALRLIDKLPSGSSVHKRILHPSESPTIFPISKSHPQDLHPSINSHPLGPISPSTSPRTTNIVAITMSIAHQRRPTGPFSPQYVNGVYLPSAVLCLAVSFWDWHFLPYTAIAATCLGAVQVYRNRSRSSTFCFPHPTNNNTEVKKTLKPDVYQNFPLKEKTQLSHNVAM